MLMVQYADQGFVEVDRNIEWDNDYPNPVRFLLQHKTVSMLTDCISNTGVVQQY